MHKKRPDLLQRGRVSRSKIIGGMHHSSAMEFPVRFVIAYSAQKAADSTCRLSEHDCSRKERLFLNLPCSTLTRDGVVYTKTVLVVGC